VVNSNYTFFIIAVFLDERPSSAPSSGLPFAIPSSGLPFAFPSSGVPFVAQGIPLFNHHGQKDEREGKQKQDKERITKLAMNQQKEYERQNQQELDRQRQLQVQEQNQKAGLLQMEQVLARQEHKIQQQREAEALQLQQMQQQREAEALQLEQQMQQQQQQQLDYGVAGPPDSPQARGGSPSTQLILRGADSAVDGIAADVQEGEEVLRAMSLTSGDDVRMVDVLKRNIEEQEETDQKAQTTLTLNPRTTRSRARDSKRAR
jgi:hypothetical protein